MRRVRLISVKRLGIFVLIFGLVVSISGVPSYSNINTKKKQKIIVLSKDKSLEQQRQNRQEIHIKYVESLRPKPMLFVITAYDLSIQSCGKSRNNPSYGITKDGRSLRGLNWKSARVVSVDPNIIPLGTKVLIQFQDEKHKKYDGVYISDDTGIAIKGNKIDLFIRDVGANKVSKEAISFGKVKALVTILPK